MDLATKIKGLLKEADLYCTQGLLIEARDRFHGAIGLIRANAQIKNREKLLERLNSKLEGLEAQIHKVENAPLNPELSAETQTLIKKLFSFSQASDEDNAALDGAIALTKFGQYPRAIAEFEALLDRPSVRMVAAKNILRCHLATDDVEAATVHYGRWVNDPRFNAETMGKVRSFLETLLSKKGVAVNLLEPKASEPLAPPITVQIKEPEEDEVLDISAVRFQVPEGPRKGRFIDYEVSFQSGNVISILISERDKEVVEALRIDETLENIELTSTVAIFNGTAKIKAQNQIPAGPRKGSFSIDLEIKSA